MPRKILGFDDGDIYSLGAGRLLAARRNKDDIVEHLCIRSRRSWPTLVELIRLQKQFMPGAEVIFLVRPGMHIHLVRHGIGTDMAMPLAELEGILSLVR